MEKGLENNMDKGKRFYLNDLYILRPSRVKKVTGEFIKMTCDDTSTKDISGVRQMITFETIPNQIVIAQRRGSISDYHYTEVFESSDGTEYPYFTHSHFYDDGKLSRDGLKVNEKSFGYVGIVPDDIIPLSSLDDLRFIKKLEGANIFEKIKYFDKPFSRNRVLKAEYHSFMPLDVYSLEDLLAIRKELDDLLSCFDLEITVKEYKVVKEPNKTIMMDGIFIGSRSAYAGTCEDREYEFDRALRKYIR